MKIGPQTPHLVTLKPDEAADVLRKRLDAGGIQAKVVVMGDLIEVDAKTAADAAKVKAFLQPANIEAGPVTYTTAFANFPVMTTSPAVDWNTMGPVPEAPRTEAQLAQDLQGKLSAAGVPGTVSASGGTLTVQTTSLGDMKRVTAQLEDKAIAAGPITYGRSFGGLGVMVLGPAINE